jgi:RNA polymerase sigma factor (sigma-70 family)
MTGERAYTDHLFRRKYGEILGALLRSTGYEHFPLAEEALQSAFEKALERWPYSGTPDNPPGWLYTVARNELLEALRRKKTEGEKVAQIAGESENEQVTTDADRSSDDLVAMILLCCNSPLPEKSQLCLMLKAACGFSVREIARAFGMHEEAVKKMVTRAKEKVDRSIVREPDPDRVAGRFPVILETIYALFTEGYAASTGDSQLRREIADDALWLAQAMLSGSLTPETRKGELYALIALMLFHMARFDARTDGSGVPVRLQEQDRSRWDRAMLRAALDALTRSQQARSISIYHIEARIAAEHCRASSFESTDWKTIVRLYDRLLTLKDTVEVRLNRIVALRYSGGAAIALEELNRLYPATGGALPMVQSFLLHSVRADLLEATGEIENSRKEWEEALENAPTEADYSFVANKVRKIS